MAVHNGVVDVRSWFDYAAGRVPELQQEKMEAAVGSGRGFAVVDGEQALDVASRTLQRPRPFYRIPPPSIPFVLARDPNWYVLAAQAGDLHAMRVLAAHYESGTDVPRDSAMAEKWRRKAADAGMCPACWNLPTCTPRDAA
jgi:hypothetical protein